MGPAEPIQTPSAPTQPSRAAEPILLSAGVLAWLGSVVCVLLLQKHAGVASVFCPVRTGCDTVLSSPYAAFFGIPLPWLGGALYLAILTLLLCALGTSRPTTRTKVLGLAIWLTVVGASFSVVLMVLQFALVRAFCPLCTASALVMIALVFVGRRAERLIGGSPAVGLPAAATALGVVAVVSVALLLLPALDPPASRRAILVDLAAAQVTGPRNARVQIVVFSDFQCHFCAELAPVLRNIREQFPADVLIAYRYFPLDGHPRAMAAAIAAQCAAEQGAFWTYHDKLFAESGDFSDGQLLAVATALGLDEQRFRESIAAGGARKVVEASYREAMAGGLEGVPAVFLNGTLLKGPVRGDKLVEQIKQRLTALPTRSKP